MTVTTYKIRATSILTGGPATVDTPLDLVINHECYAATLTAPASQTGFYFLSDADVSLTFGAFTTVPTGCLVNYDLFRSDGTTPYDAALFNYLESPTDEVVTFKSTIDPLLVGTHTSVIKGNVVYGTATATTSAIFEVIDNPCIPSVVGTGQSRTFDFEMNTTP